MKKQKIFNLTNEDKKIIKEFNKKFAEALIYSVDGKKVTQSEFVNYIVEKIEEENENHIPYID